MKESQNKTILAHLQKYGYITSIQAIRLYTITRLSGRIYDLKEKGYTITSLIQFDPSDHRRHWASYHLSN